jgi:hypothetical protein
MRKTTFASAAVLAAGLAVGFASPASADQAVSGNQINIPVDVALDVCGNTVAVLGDAQGACQSFVDALKSASGGAVTLQSNQGGGLANGNQIVIPVNVALNVCGNTITALGEAKGTCDTIVEALEDAADDVVNSSDVPSDGSGGGLLNDNKIAVPIDADVDVCGNAVSVLGSAESDCPEEDTAAPNKPAEPEQPGGGSEQPKPDEGGEKPAADDKPAEDAKPAPAAEDTLPVTGAALGGLVAAAVAALGGGGAAMYFTRRKRNASEN